MFYTRLQVQCHADYADMLTAELAEIGFDTFLETPGGFEAYSEEEHYDKAALDAIHGRYSLLTPVGFSIDQIPKQNWNEEWEKNYHPINVEDRCLIRAAFHQPDRKYPYEIIITPKMSFGTGHHQTTYLMIKSQLDIDHRNKRVMDAGCGTAILSVMACKLGASEVEAFDIDEWSVINGRENAEVNGCGNIRIQQGKIGEVKPEGKFDLILANINRNVLMDEIAAYATYLPGGGLMLLSGFYTHDIAALLEECESRGLHELGRDNKETWASLLLKKLE